jgi:hypothetical protein
MVIERAAHQMTAKAAYGITLFQDGSVTINLLFSLQLRFHGRAM